VNILHGFNGNFLWVVQSHIPWPKLRVHAERNTIKETTTAEVSPDGVHRIASPIVKNFSFRSDMRHIFDWH
jgi:hypothetical protein